jgi:hypothetical protein
MPNSITVQVELATSLRAALITRRVAVDLKLIARRSTRPFKKLAKDSFSITILIAAMPHHQEIRVVNSANSGTRLSPRRIAVHLEL